MISLLCSRMFQNSKRVNCDTRRHEKESRFPGTLPASRRDQLARAVARAAVTVVSSVARRHICNSGRATCLRDLHPLWELVPRGQPLGSGSMADGVGFPSAPRGRHPSEPPSTVSQNSAPLWNILKSALVCVGTCKWFFWSSVCVETEDGTGQGPGLV